MTPRMIPKSRSGKKQVVAFLAEADMRRLLAFANARDVSLQEAVCLCLNTALEARGYPALVLPNTKRVFRRRAAASTVKTEDNATRTRVGKRSVSAWIEEGARKSLRDSSRALGLSVSDLVLSGLDDLT